MIIEEVVLAALDLGALADFYRWLPVSRGSDLRIEIGRSLLVFEEGDRGPTHFAIDVTVGAFDEVAEWADASFGLVRSRSGETRFRFESWRARACYFLDPAGNLGEFIAREERSHCARFVGLSEIALVVDDVGRTRQDLLLPAYGEPGTDFAALGDPDGLFIVAKTGRPWYPDQSIPSCPVETRATVRAENRRFQVRQTAGVGTVEITKLNV